MPKLKNPTNGNKKAKDPTGIREFDAVEPEKTLRKLNAGIEASRKEIELVHDKLSRISQELDHFSGERKAQDPLLSSSDILDLIQDPAAELDESLRLLKANESFCQTFGLNGKNWIGGYIYDWIGELSDKTQWERLNIRSGMKNEQKISFRLVRLLDNRRREIFDIKAGRLSSNSKEEARIFFTARRLQETGSHFSMAGEGAFEIMAENAPVMIWVADTAKKRIYFNKAWLTFTGKTIEEESGHGWESRIHPEDLERSISIFNSAFDKRKEYKKEYRLKRKDGEYRWILSQGVPFFKDGIFAGYIGSCVDINYRVEQELQKDEFLSIVSHELKTPLTTMEVYTDLLRQLLFKDEKKELAEFTDKLSDQINRLVLLIKQIMDVSWINGKTLYFNNELLNINKLIEEIIGEKQTVIKSHRFISHLNPVDEILGDKVRLMQVLDNVISNAVKYSPEANRIYVTTSQKDHWVTISVKDEGIGIPSADIKNIFNRFFRSPQSARTFPGLGLGLYVSKEIIKKHKGKLYAVSEVGNGSTFNISFPSALLNQSNA